MYGIRNVIEQIYPTKLTKNTLESKLYCGDFSILRTPETTGEENQNGKEFKSSREHQQRQDIM